MNSEQPVNNDIVIVDDNEHNIKLLAGMLNAAGYTIRPANSGTLALRSIRAKTPALILLDVKMPDLDGYEVCHRLKTDDRTRVIPIIFISVLDSAQDKIKGFQAGGVDFITKPFEKMEVLARVQTHLALRRAHVELERRAAELESLNAQLNAEITERQKAEEALRTHQEHLEILISERTFAMRQEIVERQKAEDALRESELMFRTLFEEALNPILIADEQGYYQNANQAALDFLECRLDELTTKTVWDFAPPGTLEQQQQDHAPFFNRKTLETEYLIHGNIKTLLLNIVPLILGNQHLLFGIGQDITDRKHAEEALHESEARWQFALEGSGDGVWDWNAQTNTVFFSRQWKVMLGYEPDEIGNTLDEWASRVHPEDRDRVYASIQQHFDGQTPIYTSEHRVRCKNGEYKWILDRGKVIHRTADGKPLRVIGTHTDITERKQAEQILHDSEAKFRRLVENMPDIMYMFSTVRGGIYYSPHLETILGYTPDYLYQHPMLWNQSIHPDDVPAVVAAIQQFQQGQNFKVEYRIKDVAGEWRWLYDRSIGRQELPGEVLIEGLALDITDRKRGEEELQRARNAAEAANRAKSLFLAHVSHELRTPLTAMLGYMQIFRQQANFTDAQQQGVTRMLRNGEHLLSMINDLLDLSKIEADKITLTHQTFALHASIQNIVASLQGQAQDKGLTLHCVIASDVPAAVTGDEPHLRQILFNLLSNAIKFTEQGSVSVQVFELHEGERQSLTNSETQNPTNLTTLRFKIEDTGIGIPAHAVETIFQPFHQLPGNRSKTKGTGLGLSISRRLARLMQSDIRVRSTEGQGSVFWFDLTLPVIDAAYPDSHDVPAATLFTITPPSEPDQLESPPMTELRQLDEFARSGNIIELRKQLTRLESADPRWRPFVNALMPLARDIEIPEIRTLLRKYIEKGSETRTEVPKENS